ncbi:MAG: hypothetical protein L0J52_02805, partial [Corynebacterium casei]|uniref:hypothetical protein n=1 Tax=Corynebacterium casei TaxID=160386 RepID=UPI002647611A
MDDKPKSLSSTEKQDQPVSPSNPVSPSLNEEQAAATAAAAADLPALNGQLDSRPIPRPEVVPEPGLEDASQAEQEASESEASNGAESGAGAVGLR